MFGCIRTKKRFDMLARFPDFWDFKKRRDDDDDDDDDDDGTIGFFNDTNGEYEWRLCDFENTERRRYVEVSHTVSKLSERSRLLRCIFA